VRLWREGGRWRVRVPRATYWGPLRPAIAYGLRVSLRRVSSRFVWKPQRRLPDTPMFEGMDYELREGERWLGQ
jgi:hypothetical protein